MNAAPYTRRPIILGPVESRKPWGAELWLNSTHPAASAAVREAEAPTTLAELAAGLRPLVRAGEGERLECWIGMLRKNRADIVDVLNEIDLRSEAGNLLLTPAGVIHAIFGLSHQTHPLDHTRAALQALLRNL